MSQYKIDISFKRRKVSTRQQHRIVTKLFKNVKATLQFKFETDCCATLYISEINNERADKVFNDIINIMYDNQKQLKYVINGEYFQPQSSNEINDTEVQREETSKEQVRPIYAAFL